MWIAENQPYLHITCMNWSYILRRKSIGQIISAALQYLFYYTSDRHEIVAAYLEMCCLHSAVLQLWSVLHITTTVSGKWSQKKVEIFCWLNTDDQDRGVINWLSLLMVSDSYMETPASLLPVSSLFKQDVFLISCSCTFHCTFIDNSV